MRYVDFHTHFPSREGEIVIEQDIHSWGIHPWKADAVIMPSEMPQGDYLAVGECGLDRLCPVPMDVQYRVFAQQVAWSEQKSLPIILHCVKAFDQILALRSLLKTRQSWIMHGFRGKPQQLHGLLSRGFYVSFGFQHNMDSLKECPLESMLLETDADERPVRLLYEQVAQELSVPLSQLVHYQYQNYTRLFQNCR